MNSKKVFVIISITLCIFLSLSSIIIFKSKAAKPYPKIHESSVDIYTQIRTCYNDGKKGPMLSINGTLLSNDTSKDVYWIFLSGCEVVEEQPTNLESCIYSSLEQNSKYKLCVMSNILKYIPYNSNIILSGHSLGGMTAQQIANTYKITQNYNILYTITFGSPLMSQNGREGKLKRFIDTFDPVPLLSISNFTYNKIFHSDTEIKGTSIYKNPLNAHSKSYLDENTWGQYDVLGTKDGNATFSFLNTNLKYYQCKGDL